MKVTIKYERHDFFGHRIYTEDTKQCVECEDMKKVFRAMASNYDIAINVNSTVVYWDNINDWENRMITVKSPGLFCNEWDIDKQSFESYKRTIYKALKKGL